MAMAASTTNIKNNFKTILKEAEEKLLRALLDHYQQVEQSNKESSVSILATMNTLASNLPPGVLVEHDRIMKATKENIQNVNTKKHSSTNNKLAALHLEKNGKRKIFISLSSSHAQATVKQQSKDQTQRKKMSNITNSSSNTTNGSCSTKPNTATSPTPSTNTQEELRWLLHNTRQQAALQDSQITTIPETPEGTYRNTTPHQVLAFCTPDSRLGCTITPVYDTPEYRPMPQQDFRR